MDQYNKTLYFINNYIPFPENSKEALQDLDILIKYIGNIHYTPDTNHILDLIKHSNVLQSILKLIVENILDENEQIPSSISNDIFITFIDTYTMIRLSEQTMLSDDSTYISNHLENYIKEISRFPILTTKEEQILCYQILKGNEQAREKLICCNLRLVVSIAKRYFRPTIDPMEIIQEGNRGLLIAADKFDITRGFKFSTYATRWIKQAITSTIFNFPRTIELSRKTLEKMKKLKQAKDLLLAELSREPNINELMQATGFSKEEIIALLTQETGSLASLDSSINDDRDLTYQDLISTDENIEVETINASLSIEIKKLLENCNLNDREIFILVSLFGLDNNPVRTVRYCAKKLHVTPQRIKQIKAKIFIKIKKSPLLEPLAIYMQDPTTAEQNAKEFRKLYRSSRIGNRKV